MTEFYDLHEQTKYQLVISSPRKMEDLSDLFISSDELTELIGPSYRSSRGYGERNTITLRDAVAADIKKLTDKLDASGKKSIPIDNEELLDVLKQGYMSDFTADPTYGRHGDRVCYTNRYQRKKHKATQSDVAALWLALQYGFKDKYDCYPSHITRWERHIGMFKAFKKIVGWRRILKHTSQPQTKFFRQIWDNPEEYF